MPSNEEVLSTYILTLHGPGQITGWARDDTGEFAAYSGISPMFLREMEEDLNDLLPDGYHVEIKEWNE